MKKRFACMYKIGAYFLIGVAAFLFTYPAKAQLAAPNEAGVALSHVHLIVTDAELHKKLWINLFRQAGQDGGIRGGSSARLAHLPVSEAEGTKSSTAAEPLDGITTPFFLWASQI